MSFSSRPVVRWVVYICAAIGTIGPGVLAVRLFVDAATAEGRPGGNILRVAAGIVLLVVAVFFLVVGVLYFKSTTQADGEFRRE
jgi:hypothetical protein